MKTIVMKEFFDYLRSNDKIDQCLKFYKVNKNHTVYEFLKNYLINSAQIISKN